MKKYLKILGSWLAVWLLLSLVVAFFLAGPGGAAAIFLALFFLIGLIGACIHCVVVALRSKNKKQILSVSVLASLLLSCTAYQLVESTKCKFPETKARKHALHYLSKSERNAESLGNGTLMESQCVYRFEYKDSSSNIYLYVSGWGDVSESKK